ncbi:MAG: sulfur carrier protein ThiS adenylyltransferase ThiF [Candidatus Omnitrophota bacterium]
MKSLRVYFSDKDLLHLQSLKVGIAGTGGLGSNIAVMLARSGLCQFCLLDRDRLEAANLNRQHFFPEHIDRPKVTCLKEQLVTINPDISCREYYLEWSPGQPNDPFPQCDILFEAFDGAETKARFIDYYSGMVPCLISGNGMCGLNPLEPLPVRRVADVFVVGDGVTDVSPEQPPLAPRVTACAAKMAEIGLAWALGKI